MKRLILMAILAAGCGGTQAPATIQAPSGNSPALGCETNLDAGTVCDPCPGATIQNQIEHDGWTERFCGCAAADGGTGAYMDWPSCGAGAGNSSCANMLALWNDLCHRHP